MICGRKSEYRLFFLYICHSDVVAMANQNKEVVATYEYDTWGNVLKSDTKGIAADNIIRLDMRDTCMIKRLACII
nr:hypothetical protein [Bacillus thuringiensis]